MFTLLGLSSRTRGLFAFAALSLVFGSCREAEEYPDVTLPPAPATGEDPDRPGTGGRGGTGGARRGGASGSAVGGGGRGGMGMVPVMPGTGGAGAPDAAGPPVDDAAVAPAPDTNGAPAANTYRVTGAATWRGNAAGAYTILHEGTCDPAFIGILRSGEPELTMRQLKGAFSLVVNSCETGRHWTQIKAMVSNGHELLHQGFTGACLGRTAAICGAMVPRSTNLAREIDMAVSMVRERAGVGPGVFVFPYDICDAMALARVKSQGFLGARCGLATSNGSDFADPFAIKFDLWGPAHSGYRNAPACSAVRMGTTPQQASADCRRHVLDAPLDEAITKKTWVVRNFHGFQGDPGQFEPVAVADYRRHLDLVAMKVAMGALWVAGPTEIIKYRFARQACGMPTVAGNKLTFAAPSADCMKNATAVSYLVTTEGSDPAALTATQAGQPLAVKKLGPGSFVVDADPTKGEVIFAE